MATELLLFLAASLDSRRIDTSIGPQVSRRVSLAHHALPRIMWTRIIR